MARLIDSLETHWLALALLLVAGILGSLALRRRRRRPLGYWAGGFIAFAFGSIALAKWKFKLSDDGNSTLISEVVLQVPAVGFAFAVLVLLFARRWSATFALVLMSVLVIGLGGLVGRELNKGLAEVAKAIRWTEFTRPWWLVLLAFVPVVFVISRKSLSGLGSTRKWLAISARALVVACLVMALAEPRVRRPSENVTVIFIVDRSLSVPQDLRASQDGSEPIDQRWERIRGLIETAIAKRGVDHRADQTGVIYFGKRPKLAYPPAAVDRLPLDERAAGFIDGNYTDIGAAIKLALASFPEGSSRRIVLVSDGNENLGSAEAQAELARKNGVSIDTVALAPGFINENEVLVQSVEAPPLATQGARLPIRVLIRNAHPTREIDGYLDLTRVGRQGDDLEVQQPNKESSVEIEPTEQVLDTKKNPPRVRLVPGLNVFRFHDRDQSKAETSYTYKAAFLPISSVERPGAETVAGLPGDRSANNRASAAVVARGQKRILFVDPGSVEATSPHLHLIQRLRDAKQRLDFLPIDKLPGDKNDLGVFLSNYDCIVLANVPADLFTNDQMETIRQQVHDQGCGLVMVGGPDAYGPGGYQQTPIEAALPVDCEIKAKKAAGKGGLVLVMHASEMADGNKWQKVIAKLAVQRLGSMDMVGVVDYGLFNGSVNWQIPFQEIGDDKEVHFTKIDKMSPGDMPDFDPFLKAAADTLSNPTHKLSTRHVIVISDGDPNYSGPGRAAVAVMKKAGITCTTIGVATHGVNEDAKMQIIANGTDDGNGKPGNFHKVTDPTKLPAIYIKETRRISQSFIYKDPFTPTWVARGGPADGLPNVLPRLYGFVRTTKKDSPLCTMHIEGPVDEQSGARFPVLASWRYGLGKSVAFTADARTQPKSGVLGWDKDWAGSDIYQKHWEQTVTWAMREAERGNLTLVTEYKDGRIRVLVDARDTKDGKDKPVAGLTLKGAVSLPSKPAPGEKVPTLEFKSKGAGLYEAEFVAEEAGAYFVRVEGSKGAETFDSARAGITVPYSPEYADLETNAPLLERVAVATGGNYSKEAENAGEVPKLAASADFFRKAPSSIRSLQPFWYWLVFAAALFLLFDVGARRISLESKEIRQWGQRAWAKLRRQTLEETDEDSTLGNLMKRKLVVSDTLAKKRATRKFEPDASVISEPAPAGADEYASQTSGPPLPSAPPVRDVKPVDDDDGDDFLTRMRKAKERGKK